MNVLENFKNLFLDVWKEGISGINISEILIALAIFTFFLFLRGVFSKFVVKKLESYVSKTTNSFDKTPLKKRKKVKIAKAINISEIFIPDIPSFQTSKNKFLKFSNTFTDIKPLILSFHLQD